MFVAKLVKLTRIIQNKAYMQAMRRGAAAGIEHEALMRSLSCNTVVDIGANRGQFALVARHCFPQAHIFSFEPLQDPVDTFQRVFSGDEQVDVFRAAIGPTAFTATMYVSGHDDSSSLLPITDKQNQIFPGTKEVRTDTVNVGPLGSFISTREITSPALLKLDVQGFELSALEGCENLLPRFDWIYVECSFVELYEKQALADEVIAWLQNHEFVLRGVYNVTYDSDGIAIQGDFLFSGCANMVARSP